MTNIVLLSLTLHTNFYFTEWQLKPQFTNSPVIARTNYIIYDTVNNGVVYQTAKLGAKIDNKIVFIGDFDLHIGTIRKTNGISGPINYHESSK